MPLKPEEQLTEDIHDRTVQAQTTKPAKVESNYPQSKKDTVPQQKVGLGVEMVCPGRDGEREATSYCDNPRPV